MAGKSRRSRTGAAAAAAAALAAAADAASAAGTETSSVAAHHHAAATTTATTTDDTELPVAAFVVMDNVLWTILQQLDVISKTKSRSLEALQAISDGKCNVLFLTMMTEGGVTDHSTTISSSSSSSSSKSKNAAALAAANEPHDGYWIVLATHVLNRLLRQLRHSTTTTVELTTATTATDTTTTTTSSDLSRDTAWITAHVALRLTQILLWHDKTRLEKTASSSTIARNLLGRALGSITLACVRSMERLCHMMILRTSSSGGSSSRHATGATSTALPDEMDASAMLAAATALDTVVHFQPLKPTSSELWNRAQTSLLAAASVTCNTTTSATKSTAAETTTTPMVDLSRLQSSCDNISKALGMNTLEGPLVHLLLSPTSLSSASSSRLLATSTSMEVDHPNDDDTAATTTAPKRNLRRAAATKPDVDAASSSPLLKAWEPVLKSMAANSVAMEGGARVSIRRWPSIVLLSLDQGQERLLHHVVYQQLLQHFDRWSNVMSCPAVVSTDSKSTSTSSAAHHDPPNKKRGAAAAARGGGVLVAAKMALKKKSEKPSLMVPGNVTLVALICRLLQTFSEAVHLCGHRPPTSGMDVYVAAIWKASASEITSGSSTPTPSKRARKSKSSAAATSAAAAAATADASHALLHATDFRHLATAICYQLLVCHMTCLRENAPTSVSLVNDDDDLPLQDLPRATYYPLVHRALDSLCRVTPFGSGTVLDQMDMTKKLLTLASCWILQLQSPPAVAAVDDHQDAEDDDAEACGGGGGCVDAKLSNFAITQLGECWMRMEHAENDTAASTAEDETKPQDVSSSTTTPQESSKVVLSNEEEDRQIQAVMDTYRLLLPLAVPAIPKPPPVTAMTKSPGNKRKHAAAVAAGAADDAMNPSTQCTYAGVLDPNRLGDEGVAGLLVRSTLESTTSRTNKKSLVTTTRPALLSKLMDLVQVCYDTPTTMMSSTIDDNKVAATDSKKRAAASTTKGRRKKRKVTKKGRQEEAFDESESGTNMSDGAIRSRINSVRAGLATEVLNCLRIILTVPSASCSKIQNMLRKTFSLEHVEKIVTLGDMLEEVILVTRMKAEPIVDRAQIPLKSSSKSLFHQSTSKDFTHFERSLWSAHMNLCVTIGRGKVTFLLGENSTVATNDKVFWLRNIDNRFSVFQTICSSGSKYASNKSKGWPLCLSVSHHALLVSDMTSEPIPKTFRESLPERFLVQSFVISITAMLEDLSTVPPMDAVVSVGQTRLDIGIPLSLRNARLFTLAFLRIDVDDRQSILSQLVCCLVLSISNLKADDGKDDLFKTAAVSGFLARVITTCVTLTNLTLVKDGFYEPLVKLMGPAQCKLVAPFLAEKWYTAERCFMGLFSDWESPSFPIVPVRGNLCEISSDTATKLNAALKLALTLGIESSKVDRCHLLFAAWNSIAISPLWSSPVKNFPTLPTSLVNFNDSILLLSQMRDDICALNETLTAGGAGGMASKMRRERHGGLEASASELKSKLLDMIKRADTLSSSLLHSLTDGDDRKHKEVPPESFSILSGIAVYVAFAVAKHTSPGATLIANSQPSQKCSRGYLSECVNVSDPEELAGVGSNSDSEGESAVDDEADILTKLHDACLEFGAAPCHPDWLDNSCSLRTGISAFDALEASSAALRCLSKIAATSCSQYHMCWQRAMRIFSKSSADSDCKIALALQLSTFPTSSAESSDALSIDQLKESVGLVCGIDSAAMDLLFFEYDVSHQDSVEAFCPNSSQWIFGQRPHPSALSERWMEAPGELRALDEWELLMSTVLVESCHDFDFGSSSSCAHISEKNIREAHQCFANAERWRCVFERAVSNMMPASALFRLAVSGVGRSSHPLNSETMTYDDIDKGSLEFVEPVPTSLSVASTEQANAVVEALATLVCCASKCQGDHAILDSCKAIATNLLVDSKVWLDLETFEAFRSVSTMLYGLRSIVPGDSLQNREFSQAVTELVSVLTTHLSSPHYLPRQLSCCTGSTLLSKVITSFGPRGDFRFDTVGGKRYDSKALMSSTILGCDLENFLPFKEKFGAIQKPALLAMVSALCGDRLTASGKARAFFASILSQLAWLEGPHSSGKNALVVPALIDAFNGVPEDILKKVVSIDVCSRNRPSCDLENSKDRESFRENLCFLLAFLLGQVGSRFKEGKKVFKVLMGQFGEICKLPPPSREKVLSLLFLYASRYGSLGDVGSRLMSSVLDNPSDEVRAKLDCAVRFFSFVRDLRRGLNLQSGTIPPNSLDKSQRYGAENRNFDSDEFGKTIKRTKLCSFAGMSGYHWQHWYNCYSCGLVGDTGCCTLCALTCHFNHEVSYSRYSSFFCDCGAGNAAVSEEQHPVQCKCLSPLSENEVSDAFESDLTCKTSKDAGSEPERRDVHHKVTLEALALDIAQKAFAAAASKAVQDLLLKANEGNWVQSLLKLMSGSSESMAPIIGDDSLASGSASSQMILDKDCVSDEEMLQKSLLARKGKPLDLFPFGTLAGMLPIRAVKTSTFQLKLSVDNVSDQPKRAIITKSDNKRTAIAADSRGRLIVAEQRSLVFCSAVPVVNVRYEGSACELPFGRAQMTILGSYALGFLVVGMERCLENERFVVVWGVTEACVVVLSSTGDSIERKFELVVDPGNQDSDPENVSIVKCLWIPGSATTAVVACGPFVRVYDIGRDQANRVPPIIGFFLGYDTVLRDLAIIPVVEQHEESANSPRSSIYKLLLLLGNGQIHTVDLKFDKEGALETPGEQCFESSEGLSLPVEGVRTHCGSALGSQDSFKKTFGEGSSLTYLSQSGLVLYRCASSCVLALILDSSGKIAGSFELLPNIIKPDLLGAGPDSYGVSGPFVNWTELGVIDKGNDKAFCLACVGKSTRTSQPKLLLVVFNAHFVKVRLLSWPSSGPLGLGLSLISSFEGLTAFSVPFIEGENDSSGSLLFRERVCLAVATSNGSILFFGEELGIPPKHESSSTTTIIPTHRTTQRNRLTKINSIDEKKPSFPLTTFETLASVDKDNIRFGGECMGDQTKQALLRETNAFLVSPQREGCSLTVCLWKNDKRDESQAIVALRILVGSNNFDFIPQKVFINGRPIEMRANTKRWYDLPLTEEEVAMSLRNGFVSLGLGPSFDALNNPSLDALEVFAMERSRIDQWLPKRLSDTQVTEEDKLKPEGCDEVGNQSILLPCSQALAFLCEFLGSRQSLGQTDRGTLKSLLQATALDCSGAVRCSLMVLLEQIEPNDRARAALVDEAVLGGCAEALKQLSAAVAHNSSTQGVLNMPLNFLQKPAADVLLECLKVATTIAIDRPVEYLRSIENVSTNFSIAREVSKLLEDGKISICEGLVAKFVELCLVEMAIATTLETRDPMLATFDLISKLLASSKYVEWCCGAMSSFFIFHCSVGFRAEDRPALFAELQAARPKGVAYKCDCCAICPIVDTRYAVLEGDHDIDLCQECYRLGLEYAEKRGFAATVKVMINGKFIGGSSALSCAHINQMQPVPITRADVERLETAHLLPGTSASAITTLADTTNLVEERQEIVEASSGQAYDDFCSEVFGRMLDLVHVGLARDRPPFHRQIEAMFKFLLDLIRHSSSKKEKSSRSRQFAKKISFGLNRLLQTAFKRDVLDRESGRKVLVICLRAFADLVSTGNDLSRCLADSRDAGDVEGGLIVERPNRVLCDVHNFPAVRRRCAHGIDKDRRFYVCGKEKAARCDFFVWADEIDKGSTTNAKAKNCSDPVVQSFLWELLLSPSNADNMPMHVQICTILEQEMASLGGGRCIPKQPLEIATSTAEESCKAQNYLEDLICDFHDGVFCSREKLQGSKALRRLEAILPSEVQSRSSANQRTLSRNPTDSMLEASLDLFAALAGTNPGASNDERSGVSSWYPLLCEIISSSEENQLLRCKAKRVLKILCGGSRAKYHAVRDHFVFGFQFRNFLRNSDVVLETSLALVEQARQCSSVWNSSDKVDWTGLSAAGLLGCQDLVPEDALSIQRERDIAKILDEIWNVIKSRGGNWRRFCGLLSLPRSHREVNQTPPDARMRPSFSPVFSVPPIISLFWTACSLRGSNQLKAMMLVDAALVNWAERKGLSSRGKGKNGGNSTTHESVSSDEEANQEMGEEKTFDTPTSADFATPESILLAGPHRVSIAELLSFVLQFVCTGRTSQVRKVACHITCKLFQALEVDEQAAFFTSLAGEQLDNVGAFGKASVDFLMLLQTTLRMSTPTFIPISEIAERAASRSLHQLRQLKFCGDWIIFDLGSASSGSKKRIDLSLCVNCHRTPTAAAASEEASTRSHDGEQASTPREAPTRPQRPPGASAVTRPQGKSKWLPEQVQPFVRRRLDGSKDESVSNEFATFAQLKLRLAISEVHVSVSDPRGRYVKTITVFFTPRPVADVDILKSDDYSGKWQRCATLSLARGANRASCSLPVAVVASNLKFEYTEFYERAGGSKASDGSLLVHCPRCTRVVQNAHGVCGNCGEVAFQCRKCRHINYDRLDAFLCVECGYCAAGNFSFEVTAGVASNAVAITNDEDYERSLSILGAATKLSGEIRTALTEHIEVASRQRKAKTRSEGEQLSGLTSDMKRAFRGEFPLATNWKADDGDSDRRVTRLSTAERLVPGGSVVAAVATSETSASRRSSSGSNVVDRTRSLLRIARQIRSDSSGGRRSTSDVILRHFGRGLSIDSLDEEGDIIDLLEGASGGVLGTSDPLGRLVASIQSRSARDRERGEGDSRSGQAAPGGSGGGGSGSAKTDAATSSKDALNECEKLYQLSREAERECAEFNRRIAAWKRLERGSLAVDLGSGVSLTSNGPSNCTACCGAMALHLLQLWHRLVLTAPDQVHVSKQLLTALLDESTLLPKTLVDLKRSIVRDVATKSPKGSKLVLDELRTRLAATCDTASSEILGQILEHVDLVENNDFMDLAIQVLEE